MFDRMVSQLKTHGVQRTAKEVQNKYKSITSEYRYNFQLSSQFGCEIRLMKLKFYT